MTQKVEEKMSTDAPIWVEDSPQMRCELAERFAPFAKKMRAEGTPAVVIDTFRQAYAQLLQGATGYISGRDALPVGDLPVVDQLGRYAEAGRTALAQTAVLKLNGGLGTTMGMVEPKSLLVVKAGLTFLEIIIRQMLEMRRRYDLAVPLVLMNSFRTQQATLAALTVYPQLTQSVPLNFCQHRVPRIWQKDLAPVIWPADPELAWSPPGHGDLYLALQTSGMLTTLLAQGYQYLFVSNADNLGATVALNILGYFAAKELPFLMEVAERQAVDRKGGHLAMNRDNRLILREVAQCPPDEIADFQDIHRYSYFNTNNLWLHLPAVQRLLEERQGLLQLPLIRNEKPVDPTDPTSPRVYQLETAMGQAIALFRGAQALVVDRSRFLPVKSTNDLLAIASDAYVLDDNGCLYMNPQRRSGKAPVIDLDSRYYRTIAQFQERFSQGVPSLVDCEVLTINGDFRFDAGVRLAGKCMLQQEGDEPLALATAL